MPNLLCITANWAFFSHFSCFFEFSGVISGVTEWGLYVELDKNKCEGLVKINQISKNYLVFDKKTHSLTSTSKEIKYQLGQKVLVKILKADIEKKQVDFSLID